MKTLGAAEVRKPLAPPVHFGQQGDAFHQLQRQAPACVDVGVERRRPTVTHEAHGRPSVDEAHQVEGATQDGRVGADGNGGRVGDIGAVERLDYPPLPDDSLVAARGCGRGRYAQGAVQITSADLVDLVLRPA